MRSPRQKRRYTVGHELGHFLNPWHKPIPEQRFECAKSDMLVASGASQHLKQEAEANRFAIELLAPERRLTPYLAGGADLAKALVIASDFDISKEAAARRYVALHDETLAVLFARGDAVRYVNRPAEFPALSVWNGDRLRHTGGLGMERDELDARDWLRTRRPVELSAQMLRQIEGLAIILLRAEGADEEDKEETGVDEGPTFHGR